MRSAIAVVLSVIIGVWILRSTSEAGGVRTERGRSTPELIVPYYLNQPPVGAHISTIHMPDDGTLDLLTYDVNNAGTGVGVFEIGITRGLPDGGMEVLCQVNVACSTPTESHVHTADAGTCGNVPVTENEHLKLDVLASGCATKPDGFFTAYFTVQ